MGKSTNVIRLLKSANPFVTDEADGGHGKPVEPAKEKPDMAEDSLADEESGSADEMLAAGIASIFATIRSGEETPEMQGSEQAEDDGTTFELLSELDRLWRKSA